MNCFTLACRSIPLALRCLTGTQISGARRLTRAGLLSDSIATSGQSVIERIQRGLTVTLPLGSQTLAIHLLDDLSPYFTVGKLLCVNIHIPFT
jgi:hypothetical protein